MAEATQELRILITAQDHASQVMQNVAQSTSRASAALQGAVAGATAAVASRALDMLGDAFHAAGDAVIGFNATLEQSRIAWSTMLGGAGQAQAMLNQLQQFAATTPFEFPDVERAARRLTAMGFAAKDIIPLLTSIGNAASALGVGSEGVDRITLALGQMRTRTKVAAEEMMQLTDIGVPAWQILAQATGMSVAQVQDAVSKGKISADTFIAAFQRFADLKFGGLMEKQAQTFSGAMSNIKDSARIILSTAFEPLFNGVRDLAVAFANFLGSEGVKNFGQGIRNAQIAVAAFFQLIAGSTPLLTVFAGALGGIATVLLARLVPAMVTATVTALRMAAAFVLANLPLAALLAAAAVAGVVIAANWDGISKATGELVDNIGKLLGQLVDWLTQTFIPALIGAWTAAWELFAQVILTALQVIGQVWGVFWDQQMLPSQASALDQLLELARQGWARWVDIITGALRFVLERWNQFIDLITGIERLAPGASNLLFPGLSNLAGKYADIDRIVDAYKNFLDLQNQTKFLGGGFDAVGHFFHDILPEAIKKAIDTIKAAGGDLANLPQAIMDQIAAMAPDITDKLKDLGKDGGDAFTNGVLAGAKPLIESLNRMFAQLRAGPIQAALEDTQAAIQRAQLLLRIRGLAPEERAAAKQTIRDLTRNVLPVQELAAFDVNREVTLATRAENTAQLLQQIAATQQQLAEAQQRPIDLTVNFTQPDGNTVIYRELIEANGQAQTPPTIQQSGVRRS